MTGITREQYSHRGGGVEIDLTSYGYDGQLMSAYQNYLGGGLLGAVANDCTITGWQDNDNLKEIARELRAYYLDNSYHDEFNEGFEGRPVSGY